MFVHRSQLLWSEQTSLDKKRLGPTTVHPTCIVSPLLTPAHRQPPYRQGITFCQRGWSSSLAGDGGASTPVVTSSPSPTPLPSAREPVAGEEQPRTRDRRRSSLDPLLNPDLPLPARAMPPQAEEAAAASKIAAIRKGQMSRRAAAPASTPSKTAAVEPKAKGGGCCIVS